MARDRHRWFNPNENASAAARLWLERKTVGSAVTHRLSTYKNHVIDVVLPPVRPGSDDHDMVTLKIGSYETIDLAWHEFQQLEACLHKARADIESA